MDLKNLERRRTAKEKMIKDNLIDELDNDLKEEEEFGGENLDEDKKKKLAGGYGRRGGSNSGGASPPSCQAERCGANMTDAKRYHRRHKVCEFHSKAAVVMVSSLRQRFCQQCSRFHEITEFDESKRSCRRRLAGHNERRRKSPAETTVGVQSDVEISSNVHAVGQQSKDSNFRLADGRGRIHNSNSGASTYKSFNRHN